MRRATQLLRLLQRIGRRVDPPAVTGNERRQAAAAGLAIETKLIEEDARPDILYVRGITCRRPYVKDLISMVNSIYNGSRFEDVWLDN